MSRDIERRMFRPRDQAIIAAINRWYDKRMFTPRLESTSEFSNYGYWEHGIRTSKEACENLMEKLLAFVPLKKGMILDVACGKGATTQYLLKYYKPEDVTGINISEKQLDRCKENAPGCKFLLMSATDLEFESNTFDNIICVEAAFHFNTREKFLTEANRVLKPGGCLVLSDILVTRKRETWAGLRHEENYVKNLHEYRDICLRAGFEHVEIMDATYECWVRFCRRALQRTRIFFQRYEISRAAFERRMTRLSRKANYIRYYLLVSAQKGG